MIALAAMVLVPHPEMSGFFLAVSRKHDLADFGLPGGKVEPNETLVEAAIRETYEETGIRVHLPDDAQPFFERVDDTPDPTGRIFRCSTFLTHSFVGRLTQREAGVVAWVTEQTLIDGCFGAYNLRMLMAYRMMRTQ